MMQMQLLSIAWVAFITMTNGRPGYISDPVIDTSKRQIIYAHCVAPNKVFGPQGATNPFSIMTHSDDRACRTKLCAEPLGDLEKLFTMWDSWGWHRVTFYGDLKEPVYAFADAIGWKVTEEA
jgi:hypothetical protein